MEIQELIKRYQAKKRDFSWVSLSQKNLTGLNLSDSNFYGANLSETNLENANLSNVNFARTNLQKANLRNANLTKIKLYKTNLDDADLTNADLTGVIFNHHVSLNNTIMPDGTPYQQWLLFLEEINHNDQETEIIENNETEVINNNYIREHQPILSQNNRKKTSENLPIATLILLGLGYVFIGIVLAGMQQSLWSFLIILASSIIWLIHESLITFIPLIPALTIILSTFQIFAVVMMGVLFVMAMGGMSVFFGFRKGAILRDGIWVSTILTVFLCFFILLLIIDGQDIWAVFALIFGVIFVGIGSISSLHLQIIGYPKQETAKIFLMITSISLAFGFFMGVMIVNFMG